MVNNDIFGQRSMTQLKLKAKLVVFYHKIEDKNILYELRNECNTCFCKYILIPIYFERTKSDLCESTIRKLIKTHVSEYRKDLDRVYIVGPSPKRPNEYFTFNSIEDFKMWFQKCLDKEY